MPFAATQTLALERELDHLRLKSMAASSLKTRSCQWKKFEIFCGQFHFRSLPASSHTIALYIAFLARSLEFFTILNYVSALVTFHHRSNMPAPNLSSFEIKEALGGAKRCRHERPNKREPVHPNQLLAIHEVLHVLDSNIRETFWAACVVAFFSLLRSSNLFKNSHGSSSFLRVCDVSEKDGSLLLSVTVLRTNRYLGGRIGVHIPKLPAGHALCPYTAVLEMLCASKAKGRNALFSYREGHKICYFSSNQFLSALHRTFHAAGLPSAKISAHSFRRGGTTYAADNGVPPEALMAQGNWRSSCFQQYVTRDDVLRRQFSAALASSFF